MANTDSYIEYINDQISALEGISTKKMFGGLSFYKEGVMFGLLGNDIFCLRVTEDNQTDYEAYGMKAFMSSEKKKGLPYWEVPLEILEDKIELAKWANKAFEAALSLKK